jgi:hypothetical protein
MLQDVARTAARVPGQALPKRHRPNHARLLRQCPFPPALSGTESGPARLRNGLLPVSADGQLCGLFAVDIAGFNGPRRDDDIQVYVHRSLYDMLETVFDRSGVPWRECAHEDRGDGALVVLPPTVSVAGLVHPIPEKLLGLVRRHNRVSCEAARIQLRVATHIGPIQYDGHGFVGHDVNLLHRMLDSPALKRMLATSGAEIAFITSSYLYENVIVRRPSLIDPAGFKPLTVRVKETRTRAWAYTLGASTLTTLARILSPEPYTACSGIWIQH